jgi:hypothetical protein
MSEKSIQVTTDIEYKTTVLYTLDGKTATSTQSETQSASATSQCISPNCVNDCITINKVNLAFLGTFPPIYVDDADALILTCIDFRFIDIIVNFMIDNGYINEYDQFILAGASLGYNTALNLDPNSQYCTEIPSYNDPSTNTWKTVFNQHVNLSSALHNIKKIFIIDHMDCSAYKDFYGLKGPNSDLMYPYHIYNLKKCVQQLKETFIENDYQYFTFIADITGNVQDITSLVNTDTFE